MEDECDPLARRRRRTKQTQFPSERPWATSVRRVRGLGSRISLRVGLLLLVSAVAGAWAWLLFPRTVDPAVASPIYVSFEGDRRVEAVTVTIGRFDPTEGGLLYEGVPEMRVEVRADSKERKGVGESAAWIVLNDSILAPGAKLDCTSDCEYANEFGEGVSLLRFRAKLPGRWRDDVETGGSVFQESISIPQGLSEQTPQDGVLSMPGLDCNLEKCSGFVPSVTVTEETQLEANATALVGMQKNSDLFSYNWETSVPVARNSTQLRFSYPLLASPTLGYSQQIPLQGSNDGARRSNETRIFLAGALLGIAGGALVGALQEILPRRPSGSIR